MPAWAADDDIRCLVIDAGGLHIVASRGAAAITAGSPVEIGIRQERVAVYHMGEPVVDLWGGLRDRERDLPWEKETLACMMSVAKGISTLYGLLT